MEKNKNQTFIKFKNVKDVENWSADDKITLSTTVDGRNAGFITIPTKNISVDTFVCLAKIITKIEEEDFSEMLSKGELVIEVYLNSYTVLLVKNTIGDHVDEPYTFFKP